MANAREQICRRVALFFEDGDTVNLGIGMPTLVADYIDPEKDILVHAENGFLGAGPSPAPGLDDPDMVNAGGLPATILEGGSIFDSTLSFAMIRGGHIDYTVLGALEVDQEGNLANFMIPGKMAAGMGGAMDLAVGARTVILAMEHTAKNGSPKILKKCTLPLTAQKQVDFIVTELGVMQVTERGIVLMELAPGITLEAIKAQTGAELILPDIKPDADAVDKLKKIEQLSGYRSIYLS